MQNLRLMLITACLLGMPAFGEVISNERLLVTLATFVPCAAGGAGEPVFLSGQLHSMSSVTINGNNLHLRSHSQPQGISGVGFLTGALYHATGVTRNDSNIQGVGFPYNATFVNNFRIIGQGPGNNSLAHLNVHVTVNADGTVITRVDNFRIECR